MNNNANSRKPPSGSDRNRPQQPNSKPAPYDKGRKNTQPDEDEDDDDEDDGIEFTGSASTPRTINNGGSGHNGQPTSSSAPVDTPQPLSPNKALTSYLVPIVVMWIGNMV